MEIDSIDIGIYSNQEIRDMAVLEVTGTNLLARGKPHEGGVVDSRFGSVSNFMPCGTCLDTLCTSHTGFISLDHPVPHISWIEALHSVANATCVICGALVVTDTILETGARRVTAFGNRAKKLKGLKTSLCLCPSCGMPQPLIIRDDPFFSCEWPKKTLPLYEKIKDPVVSIEDVKAAMARPYTNWTLSYLLRMVPEEDQRKMGFDPSITSIDGMMLRTVLVPGNITRLPPPCDDGDSHGRGQHQLSQQLSEIVKQKKALQRLADGKFQLDDPFETRAMPEAVAKAISLLWFTISRYFRRDKAKKPRRVKVNSYAENGHKNAQCAGGVFDGKEGLLRQNNTGKRVDFSSRTVIGGDPCLDVDQIGIPQRVAKILTIPIPVLQINRNGIKQMILDGKIKQIIDQGTGNIILTNGSLESRMNITLINGWVAERYLQDGDLVVANRQPTLHRNSQLAFRVKILPGDTFRFNPSCVEGFNADFDGDEMVVHVAQTIEARAEMELMYCVHHMFHPRKCAPIFSLIQDGQIGWHLITKPDARFSREDVSRIMSVARYDPATPETISIGDTPNTFDAVAAVLSTPPCEPGKWSGHQLASALLPPFLNVRKAGVVIENGKMVSGTFNKSSLGSSAGSVVHQCLIYSGGHTTARMLSDMQRVSDKFLLTYGFNIGVLDISPPKIASLAVNEIITQAKNFISKVRAKACDVPPSGRVATAVEQKTCEVLRQILIAVSNVVANTTTDDSSLRLMSTTVRSKGSTFNMAQMMGTVSQTFVMGRRPGVRQMRRGMKRRRRNLPNEPLEEEETTRLGSSANVEVHGYVTRPFIRGLKMADVVQQSAGSREGLVDTSAKTPTSGYIQRQLVTACIDAVVQQDLTVRNAKAEIIAQRFSLDGADHTKCFDVTLDLLLQNNKAIKGAAKGYPRHVMSELMELRTNMRRVRQTVYDPDITRNEKALVPFDVAVLVRTHRCGACLSIGGFVQRLTEVCDLLDKETGGNALFVKAHLWWGLITSNVCKTCGERIANRALDIHRRARMYPGEAVGALASTSCGELSTQLMLNSFHFIATGMGGAEGVPRLEEILNASKNITTVMSFEVDVEPQYLVKQLAFKLLKDIVNEAMITSRDEGDTTLLKHHRPFIRNADPISIRFVLSRERTSACGLDVQGVADIIRQNVSGNVVVAASRRHENEWVIRLFTHLQSVLPQAVEKKFDTKAAVEKAMLHTIQGLRTRLMNTIKLCGIKGISKASTRIVNQTVEDFSTGELVSVSKTVVDVRGGNVLDVMLAIKGIRPKTFVTNDIMDIYKYLGVDCAAFVLFHELHKCISASRVAEHLVKMLVDCITYHGGIMAVNRFGINKIPDRSTLAKMAFEEAVKQITEASLLGVHDPLIGVVESSIAGKRVAVGTEIARLRPKTTTPIGNRQAGRDYEFYNDPVCVSYCEEMYTTQPTEEPDFPVDIIDDEQPVPEKLFCFDDEACAPSTFRLLSPQWKPDTPTQQKKFTLLSPDWEKPTPPRFSFEPV